MEFENIGPVEDAMQGVGTGGGIDAEAIELLILFVNFLWDEWYMLPQVMRLHGGAPIKRQRSFRNAPVKPLRKRHWTDGMEISTPSEMSAWRQLENIPYQGTGHRYVEGLGDSTTSVENYPWRAPPSSPMSLQGLIRDRYFYDALRERMQQGSAVATGVVLGTLRLTYPGYESGSRSGPKKLRNKNVTQTSQDNISKPMPDGYSMLNFKNSMTRMYRTHSEYYMHPTLIKSQLYIYKTTAPGWEKTGPFVHSTFEGNGPHLYTSFDNEIATGTLADKNLTRSPKTQEAHQEDQGYLRLIDTNRTSANLANSKALGMNTIIYVFAADWPFVTMNYDPLTQVEQYAPNETNDLVWFSQLTGNFLRFKPVEYNVSTDMNTPVVFNDIWLKNRDWTYLTHYYTKYNFKFRNTSMRPHVVEILFFKFKADTDAMDYDRQCVAVVNRQVYKYQDYFDGVSPQTQDIEIVHRKRILLRGLSDIFNNSSLTYYRDNVGTSQANYKYVVKRKYVIKKPIINYSSLGWVAFTESQAFNEYYEQQQGIYCRMQAWPATGNYWSSMSGVTPRAPAVNLQDEEEDYNLSDAQVDGTRLGFGVTCKIDKKSYFKLDEPYYKSYASAT